ncbi:methyltransferase domain-containing protein [Reichenbachiella sp. MALMAid0571]|uniref:class I SAM-dependent methyltransferase n=1 Tax=Reichenbachiella sp. MALMAid0571 TaxID=3143939 RepID=UPI0032DF362F
MQKKEWFDEWFDSIYYHILYQHRDNEEAAIFIDRLIEYLDIHQGDKILDLACGKGRHSIYLNKKGFDVTGVDLSSQNIELAKRSENATLHFEEHDMREVYKPDTFQYIFNLFTSFGYLDTKEANLNVIKTTAESLKTGGKLLIDFMNPYVVINHLVEAEEIIIDNVKFTITREYTEDEYLIKKIDIEDHGQQYHFFEKVKAIRRVEFLEYFERTNLKVVDVFGDYSLNPYQMDKSLRLIMLVEKQS